MSSSASLADIITITGFEATETSLSLPDGLEFNEWFYAGRRVARLQNASLFWLGDWINYGREHYGMKYKHALDQLPNYRYQSLANIAYVCQSVPASRRKEELHFTHHTEVASLPAKEQMKWLEMAVKDKLSTIDLRKKMRGGATFAGEREEEDGVFNISRWSREGIRWFSRHAHEIAADELRKRTLKQDLKPLVDLYNNL